MGCFVDPDVELRPAPILVPASPFCKPSTEVAGTSRDMDCHHGGGWACLDLKTGQKKWNERAVGKGSPCYADGMLYLFGESPGWPGTLEFARYCPSINAMLRVASDST